MLVKTNLLYKVIPISALFLMAGFTSQSFALSVPKACVDHDGDGWGWNGTASCQVGTTTTNPVTTTTSTPVTCDDPDGDGWGWDGTASCQVGTTVTNPATTTTTSITCDDLDGDGWGWDGTASCQVGTTITNPVNTTTSTSVTCNDPDGDGWGWDGQKSCQVPTTNNDSAQTELSWEYLFGLPNYACEGTNSRQGFAVSFVPGANIGSLGFTLPTSAQAVAGVESGWSGLYGYAESADSLEFIRGYTGGASSYSIALAENNSLLFTEKDSNSGGTQEFTYQCNSARGDESFVDICEDHNLDGVYTNNLGRCTPVALGQYEVIYPLSHPGSSSGGVTHFVGIDDIVLNSTDPETIDDSLQVILYVNGDNELELHIETYDDFIAADSPDTQLFNDDSWELFLDIGGERNSTYDSNDYHLVGDWAYSGQHTNDQIVSGGGFLGDRQLRINKGLNSKANLNPEIFCTYLGYTRRECIVTIPLRDLTYYGQKSPVIGFDVQVNVDKDGGQRNYKLGACGPYTEDTQWHDPSTIGCAIRLDTETVERAHSQ